MSKRPVTNSIASLSLETAGSWKNIDACSFGFTTEYDESGAGNGALATPPNKQVSVTLPHVTLGRFFIVLTCEGHYYHYWITDNFCNIYLGEANPQPQMYAIMKTI